MKINKLHCLTGLFSLGQNVFRALLIFLGFLNVRILSLRPRHKPFHCE